MLLRAPDHGGFWQSVSGTAEPEDETLRHTALRELREETGLDARELTLIELAQWTEFQSIYSETFYRQPNVGIVCPAGTTPTSLTLSEEHVEARLVTFDEARALVRWDESREALTALEQLL